MNVDRIKSGKYAQICEKLSARLVMSDEFGHNGICQFYLTKHMLSLSFGMIFQVAKPPLLLHPNSCPFT